MCFLIINKKIVVVNRFKRHKAICVVLFVDKSTVWVVQYNRLFMRKITLGGSAMDNVVSQNFIDILKEELLPAMGCTEPIAVAYAAALAKNALGELPTSAEITVSGNILKNVKSVVVPNTGGMRGVAAAVAVGVIAGKPEKKLEVLSEVACEDVSRTEEFIKTCKFSVKKSCSGCVFDIGVRLNSSVGYSFVRIEGEHTNVVRVEKNGAVLYDASLSTDKTVHGEDVARADRSVLSVERIVEFIEEVDVRLLEPYVGRQLEYNLAIAKEGLEHDYGASVGRVLLRSFGEDVHNLARATAAAGSDARMNGCSLPVVIVSGSGNQGMVASLPVAVYAKELGVSREKLLRAVALSDLITIHLKSGIGRLSAYCGAVSAGCGAGAGVRYLYGGKLDDVKQTVKNALAIDSGIICDGAKSSCAAKIASAVDAGLLGMEMSRKGKTFRGGDGILDGDVETTIDNVGCVARNGMRETDEEIIKLMIRDCN